MDTNAVVPSTGLVDAVACAESSSALPIEVANIWRYTAGLTWIKLSVEIADIWVVRDDASGDYSYGGTRLVPHNTSDALVLEQLERLALYESALKNRLINRVLEKPELFSQRAAWPTGFVESRIGGARCLIRPRDAAAEAILSDPTSEHFVETILPLLRRIGPVLNECGGKIKLTPDFGHFAGLSDLLHEVTEHTLGISRERGGCGGKTRFSSYGVIAAMEQLGALVDRHVPVTLIGSAGAMGMDILHYFLNEEFSDIAVCDLKYESDPTLLPAHVQYLPAHAGRFTDECLKRGGVIVATTVGQELENSHWGLIPPGTQFFLAHNLSVPVGEPGKALMRQLQAQGVYALPGQMLTLGGALTSRLEWFFRRQRTPDQLFDKPMAYATIKEVLQLLAREIDQLARDTGITPYEAMLLYIEQA
ncbi:MAG TPA: hypothetical protein VFV38_37515 [Ktedonobacteraceae bacterium]|nr:hypothetical protein [Ktedonobacteraceae bacterium]